MIGTRRVISAILVVLIGVPFVAQEPRPSSGQPLQTTIDLNGLWKYMDGAALTIQHDTRTGKVSAKFVVPHPCPSGYATVDNLFDGRLQGTTLSGRTWTSCNDKLLVDACGKPATFDGDFTATVSQDEISGKYRLPYFTWTGACRGLTESTKVDPYLLLTLTRSCTRDWKKLCNAVKQAIAAIDKMIQDESSPSPAEWELAVIRDSHAAAAALEQLQFCANTPNRAAKAKKVDEMKAYIMQIVNTPPLPVAIHADVVDVTRSLKNIRVDLWQMEIELGMQAPRCS